MTKYCDENLQESNGILSPKRGKKEKQEIIDSNINYRDFYKKNISLKKVNLSLLKNIAKKNKLKCGGNKKSIIDRIETYFYRHQMANIIQKLFRAYIVRCLYEKREPAQICVNETDFYTMESLAEIKRPYLYIYKEDAKIAYGFHLQSLHSLIVNSCSPTEIKNPYNRTPIPDNTVKNVRKLHRISKIMDKIIMRENNDNNNDSVSINHPLINRRNTRRRSLTNDFYPTPIMEIYQERVRKLTEIREKSFQNRVSLLFTELDYLGNYTREEWFFELTTVENYMRFYRALFNIWYQHSNMPVDVRQKICMCGDPFENIVAFSSQVSLENVRENCLRVFENMIFMGVDDEYRKLGAFHGLSALTVVSSGARDSMPWLYESLIT
jgi:hypothetical protein